MKNLNKKEYNWYTHINDKAIIDFRIKNNISSELKLNHIYLLAKLVDLYSRTNSKIISRIINEKRYIYVSNNLILDNLLLWNIKNRQLVNLYKDLEKEKYIEKELINNTKKFIKINDDLLSLWIGTNNKIQYSSKIIALGQKVGRFFSKNEESQLTEVYKFLSQCRNINHFETEFNNYVEFKEYSGEKIHSFKSYCKLWNQSNWKTKLEKEKHNELKKQYENF